MLHAILISSIIFQLLVAYFCIKLTKITKNYLPWILIAFGILLMALRRMLSLFQITLNPQIHNIDIFIESVSLVVSILFFFGIIKIYPYIIMVLSNIKTAHKEKDELNTYLDLCGVIFVVIDINHKVKMINKKGYELLGYKDKNNIIGKNWFDNFIPERNRNNVKEIFNQLISGKVEAIEYYENPILTSSGKEKIISWHNTLLEDENGKFIGTLSAGEDITERINMEENIRKSEDKFKLLAEESPNMIFINLKGKIIFVNKKCEEILGYSKEEFYSTDFDFFKLFASESLSRIKEHFSKYLSGKYIPPYDYTLITKDGNKLDVIITTNIIDLENDKAIIGIITDITKRKQLESDLFESEKRYKDLIELCPDSIAVHSEGKLVYVNQAGIKMLKANNYDEIIGRPIFEFLHPDYWKTVRDRIQKMLINGENAPPILEKFICVDGSTIDVEVSASPIIYHGKSAVQVVLRNISERTRAEEELKQSEIKFKSLFDHIPDAIYLESLDGKIIDCNISAEKTTGYSRKELLKMSATDLVPKEVSATFPSLVNELNTKGYFYTESINIKKNGELFPVDVFMKVIYIKNENFIFVLVRDISEKRKIEMETENLETLKKDFVSFFSHEARNPLSTIKDSLDIINDGITGTINNEQKDTLSIAKLNIERLNTLVNNFLEFSKIDNKNTLINPVKLDIQIILKEILESLKKQIKEKKLKILINNKKATFALCDSFRTYEIFINILSNAIKFSPKNGNIFIDISDINDFIQISIKDEGAGIDKKELENIFKKSTKAHIPSDIKPEGIGIELSLVKHLVELMGGEIWVESEINKGTTFTFTLPKTK